MNTLRILKILKNQQHSILQQKDGIETLMEMLLIQRNVRIGLRN